MEGEYLGRKGDRKFAQTAHLCPSPLIPLAKSWTPLAQKEEKERESQGIRRKTMQTGMPFFSLDFFSLSSCFLSSLRVREQVECIWKQILQPKQQQQLPAHCAAERREQQQEEVEEERREADVGERAREITTAAELENRIFQFLLKKSAAHFTLTASQTELPRGVCQDRRHESRAVREKERERERGLSA